MERWGPTNDPDSGVGLFRDLRSNWDRVEVMIDYDDLHILDQSTLPKWLQEEAKSDLSWAVAEYDKGTFKRGDYKECIQLVIIYLGGNFPGFKFRVP